MCDTEYDVIIHIIQISQSQNITNSRDIRIQIPQISDRNLMILTLWDVNIELAGGYIYRAICYHFPIMGIEWEFPSNFIQIEVILDQIPVTAG